MRVSFVQSYPVYHDGATTAEWRGRADRDLRLPAIAASMGLDVELVALGPRRERLFLDGGSGPGYPLELFPADRRDTPSRRHQSRALVAHARERDADLHIIKGIDGGAGLRLITRYLLPERKAFALVIGGKYYNRFVPRADVVLYETEEQRARLERPRFWRRAVPPARLIRLPKSIDTDAFRPRAGVEKIWDVIAVARLLRWKNLDALGPLSRQFTIAVIGGGPDEERLRARHTGITWLGCREHHEIPALLNRARLFLHPGRYDYFPRVAAEAMACGLPVVAVRGGVSGDVIPPEAGRIVDKADLSSCLRELFANPPHLAAMSQQARAHAVAHLGPGAPRRAIQQLVDRIGNAL